MTRIYFISKTLTLPKWEVMNEWRKLATVCVVCAQKSRCRECRQEAVELQKGAWYWLDDNLMRVEISVIDEKRR